MVSDLAASAATPTLAAKGAPGDHGAGRLSLSGWSWAIFEGGRDPYIMLIMAYVFMPYVASTMVGDPVRGQALVASYAKVAGLVVAFTCPLLGSLVDRLGRRKPLLLAITVVTVPLLCSLWWASPDGRGLPVWSILLIGACLNILYAYSGVVHNALLVSAAGAQAGRASGMAYMLANAVGLVSLAVVLWAFVLPGATRWSFVPASPLFGLAASRHEPDRVVSWLSAGLLMAGAAPLVLFTRDLKRTGASLKASLIPAVRDTMAMFRNLIAERNLWTYLAAHAFIADAIGAVAMFLGIYAAGVMKWGVLQLLVFAILQSAFAAVGGFAGGISDEWLGSKRALQIALVGATACTAGVIGMSPHTILYLWAYQVPAGLHWALGPFSLTLPEALFIVLFGGVVFWATAAAGSGRALLLLITRPERSGVAFGLFALAASITAWLGPLLVATFTEIFHSQQAGFAPIVAFFLLGLTGVTLTKTKRSQAIE